VLDEAQAIKNPAGQADQNGQNMLAAETRVALTGTRSGIGSATCGRSSTSSIRGLLGSSKEFSSFVKRPSQTGRRILMGPLRDLVRPYILRAHEDATRGSLADLPDKTEDEGVFCPLEPQAGGAIPAGGGRPRTAQLEDVDMNEAQRGTSSSPSSCGEADLQPCRRNGSATARLGRAGQRQAARDCGRGSRRWSAPWQGEGARLHPVQGDDRAPLAAYPVPRSCSVGPGLVPARRD